MLAINNVYTMKTIYLVRHGQTDLNKQNIIQGQNDDYDININGVEQAKLVRSQLPQVDMFFSSPLKRAFSTARIIANKRDVIIKEDFKEVYCGSAEKCNIDDFNKKSLELTFNNYLDSNKKIKVSTGEELRKYLFDLSIEYANLSYPEGESKIEASTRFKKAIIDCFNTYNCNKIAIITHFLIMKAFLSCNIINFEDFDISSSNIIKLEYNNNDFKLIQK